MAEPLTTLGLIAVTTDVANTGKKATVSDQGARLNAFAEDHIGYLQSQWPHRNPAHKHASPGTL